MFLKLQQVAALLLIAVPLVASKGGFQSASGTLSIGSSTGNVSVSSLTFTPKAALFIWNAQVTANAATTASALGIGAAVSSSNRAAIYFRRNLNSANTFDRHTNAACMTTVDTAGTVNFAADFVSWNSNGFTVNVGTSPGVTFFVQWYVWGGADVAANLVQFDSPTSAISQSFTGMGFQPDALIIFTMGLTAAIPTNDGNARQGFGFVNSAVSQAGVGNKQVTGANTSRRSQSTSSAIYIPDTSAMWLDGNVTAMTTDGATISWNTVQASAVHLWALGLRGVRATVNSFIQGTGTGSQSVTTPEHTPSMILMGSYCRASGTAQQNDGVLSFGGATASAQANNATTTTTGGNNTGQANYNNQIITCLTAGTPTVDSQGAFTGFDPRGFTINNGTADGTGRTIVYLTLAPLPVNRFLITSWFWRLPTWLQLPSID